MPRTHRRPALTVAVGAALLALAAGCGDEPTAEQSKPTQPASGGLAAYAACLREQGIDVPEDLPSARPGRSGQADRTARPTTRPSGQPGAGNRQGGQEALRPADVDDANWERAQQACENSRPQGGRRGDG